ncbi:MAG TPA: hypothetical protein VFH27_08235 [Longimicrobiaceae bacterium]|nr:hypothetical protein [Longimicrobiaceae bacterium]
MQSALQNAPALPVPEAPSPRRAPLRTWHLFAAVSLVSMALAWANNHWVMTREVYHRVLGGQLDASRIDAQFDLMRQMSTWGYVAVPLIIALRIGLVAMTSQMVALLGGVEIPLRQTFRAAAWGFVAVLYGSGVRVMWLARQTADGLDAHTLSVTPGSLAAVLLPAEQSASLLYVMLSLVSVWELGWAVALGVSLARTGRIGRGGAAAVTLATWALLTLLQAGISAYLTGVTG